MLFIFLYLILLFIAPQLWVEPFIGMRPDLYFYAVWLGWLVVSGRAVELLRFGPQDLFFAGWFAWILVSLSVNGFGPNGAAIVLDYAKWLVLYRLTVVSLPTLGHVKTVLLMLLFFGLVLAIEGIEHMHSPSGIGWAGQGLGWVGEEAMDAGYVGRARWINIFDGPGVFCVVFTITLPIAMQYLTRPYGASARLVGLLLVVPLLVATYYTGSRGGILATLGVFGLYLLAKLRVTPARAILVSVVMLAALAAAPSYFVSTSDSSHSAQRRVEMWAEGIEMVQYNPLFGIGKGQFLSYTSKLIAHNSAVEIMGETGIPGFFLWLGIIYMAFKNLLSAYRQTADARSRAYILALGLSIAGYIMSSLFVTLEYETFYFLLALASATGASLQERPTFGYRDARWLGGIMAIFFVALKGFVMLYPH